MPVLDAKIHLDPGALAAQMAIDVRAGLTADPKTLPPKYFYDARGSELFDEITRLDGVLPDPRRAGDPRPARRRHRARLRCRDPRRARQRHLGEDAAADRSADGGGHAAALRAVRRRPCCAEGRERGGGRASSPPSRSSRSSETSRSTSVSCPGTPGGCWPSSAPRSATSSPPSARGSCPTYAAPWATATPSCSAPTWSRTRPAWSRRTTTSRGVTAEFNKNVLRVLDRDLGADFDPTAFEHRRPLGRRARVDRDAAGSTSRQHVRVAALDLEVDFAEGEELRTEISAKFRRAGVVEELADAGLRVAEWWTDPAEDFGLSLSVPL